MARIRSVHPSLFTDEAWVSCSPLARVLYIGLMTDADDQGLFEWNFLQIKMRLLPADNVDIPPLLAELVGANLIAELESGGKRLGAIRKFRTFQRPKKPNQVFKLPHEWVEYVGLTGDGSEPVPHQSPTDGEKSPQMEDGGGRMEVTTVSSETSVADAAGEDPKSSPAIDKLMALAAAGAMKARADGKTKPAARAARIPDDWAPSESDRQFALNEGMNPEEIDRAAREFSNFWRSRGRDAARINWSLVWENNINRIGERKRSQKPRLAYSAGKPGLRGPGPATFADIIAERGLADRDGDAVPAEREGLLGGD